MFSYTIEITVKMISMMLIFGLAFAYGRMSYGARGSRFLKVGLIAGVAAAGVMSYLKNATSLIDTSYWNFRIFLITLIVFAAFLVLRGFEKKFEKVQKLVLPVTLAVFIALLAFYTLPDVLAYPFSIYVSETTVFSSSYIINLGGVLIGFVLVLVAAFAANKTAGRLEQKIVFILLVITMAINEFRQITQLFNIMLSKRMIESNKALFAFVKFGLNNSNLFIYFTIAVVVVAALILCIRSTHVNEPYSNPAQHRKIIAKWRNIRRWSATTFITAAITILLMTVISGIVNQTVELSPTEDPADIKDGYVYVSFEQVDDGHLHRFGYTTENGVTVRFIVIQKPNSTAYGVGMDACDICGETGYYEKDGQVVCNRCDVVMNINTIGFQGGCNPKIVDYSVENGYIMVSIESLEQYEKDFS